MTVTDFIVNLFTPEGFVQLFGWLVLCLEFVYLLVAFVIVKEVALMNKSFKTPAALLFTMVSYIHFLMALGLVVLSLAILL